MNEMQDNSKKAHASDTIAMVFARTQVETADIKNKTLINKVREGKCHPKINNDLAVAFLKALEEKGLRV